MENQYGRNAIRKALQHYRECSHAEKEQAGIKLVRTMRNGIEEIGGITVKDLYMDTMAFNKLVRLAATV